MKYQTISLKDLHSVINDDLTESFALPLDKHYLEIDGDSYLLTLFEPTTNSKGKKGYRLQLEDTSSNDVSVIEKKYSETKEVGYFAKTKLQTKTVDIKKETTAAATVEDDQNDSIFAMSNNEIADYIYNNISDRAYDIAKLILDRVVYPSLSSQNETVKKQVETEPKKAEKPKTEKRETKTAATVSTDKEKADRALTIKQLSETGKSNQEVANDPAVVGINSHNSIPHQLKIAALISSDRHEKVLEKIASGEIKYSELNKIAKSWKIGNYPTEVPPKGATERSNALLVKKFLNSEISFKDAESKLS